MRTIPILITLVLTLSILQAQPLTKQAKKFVLDFYDNSAKSIIYKKGIDPNEVSHIIETVQKIDTLKNLRRINNKLQTIDSLILTAKEKQLIINSLKNQADTILWNEIVIPNSLIIPQNSLTAILKDKNRGWNFLHSNYGKSINSFSIPIFFRNNQLCAFYYEFICGRLCGEGVFAIYHRENNKWVRWFTISEWES